MRFAIVMPCWVYKADRRALADAFFESLLRTEVHGEKPLLILLIKWAGYDYPLARLAGAFDVVATEQLAQGVAFRGINQPLIYGTDSAFAAGVDYVVHLNEDGLVNRRWLLELEALIGRHPRARAWSVYRSAHTAVHAPIREEGNDVLVRSLNGNGLTLARDEWQAWRPDWRDHAWPENPRESGVVTLDYLHYQKRPGERWVTKRSYIEHTGTDGTHCVAGIPEYAVDFVGVA